MARNLSRLLRPRKIAIVGGGAWGRAVVAQSRNLGFQGDVWPIHPKAAEIGKIRTFRTLSDLPGIPDACFVGVNRTTTLDIVRDLAAMGAGGAICFASGFSESAAEDQSGAAMQQALLQAAGDMPILGPNCYGFINYLDGALLWPDQQGGTRVQRGVAIIAQSSNIAINLTMQSRALPLAYVVTAGNQVQTVIAEIGIELLNDPRVTALGLHIEGFGDLRAFERLAACSARLKKPLVALKVGKSAQARAATVSHTASLAGGDAGAKTFLKRLNILSVDSLPEFLETLKLLHVCGRLKSNRIASISCSGGEAALIADMAQAQGLTFPPLSKARKKALKKSLGARVALANPLDYHTYIWRDTSAMTATWAQMIWSQVAITLVLVDFPRTDRCDAGDWDCAIEAALAAKVRTGGTVAMVSTLPELMPENVAHRLIAGGIVPLCGLGDALRAIKNAARKTVKLPREPVFLARRAPVDVVTIDETAAKSALTAWGVPIPQGIKLPDARNAIQAARSLGYPVAVKVAGFAHKSEAGAVAIGVRSDSDLHAALTKLPAGPILLEQMISDAVAELLIGVLRDPAHGFVLTLAAGGVLAELLTDSVSLLLPSTRAEIRNALGTLKIAKLLQGYRGKPAADVPSIVNAVMAVQDYVLANADRLEEIEINPLLCCPTRAVAVDALIRQEET